MKKLRKKMMMTVAVCSVVLVLQSPGRAHAIVCEQYLTAMAKQVLVTELQEAYVWLKEQILESSFLTDITESLTELKGKLLGLLPDDGVVDVADQDKETLSGSVASDLDEFSNNARLALKAMTKQLHASELDQARQQVSNADAGNFTNAALRTQREEYNAKKTYQPNNQGCQFDSFARYMGQSNATTRAVMTGYANDFNRLGNNTVGTPAAGGKTQLQKARWEQYKGTFCDQSMNNGNAGCSSGGIAPNLDILPSRTIFGRETLDLTDPLVRESVEQTIFNILGYEVPDIISVDVQKTPEGKRQRQLNREYIAQMDVIGALPYYSVASGAPGAAAPEIYAQRQKMGVTGASPNPSEREIRQAIVEQVQDPNYYKELYDSPTTIPQKELYLNAYMLKMLYEQIFMEELSANAYAVETANMLKQRDKARSPVYKSEPLTGGGGGGGGAP